MKTKKELEEKKEYARLLFMQGETQKVIAQKTDVTAVTINKWVNDGGWQEQRAAKSITRPELVNKLLKSVDKLIEEANNSDDPDAVAGLGDKLSKFSATIERLDKKASIVDVIEVFMAFVKWLQFRLSFDEGISPELIKSITKYQDLYINELLQSKINN